MADRADAGAPEHVQVFVYRSRRQPETYVYLAERDDFSRLPEGLREAMGRMDLVLEMALAPDRKLARADAREVIASVRDRGFYLQMPPVDSVGTGRVH